MQAGSGCCSAMRLLLGNDDAPPLIRQAFHSDSANYWSENGIDLGAAGVIRDDGDLIPPTYDDIRDAARQTLALGHPAIFLGGDHSISDRLVRAVAEKYGPVNILRCTDINANRRAGTTTKCSR